MRTDPYEKPFPAFLFDTDKSKWRYVIQAGLVSLLPSLAIATLLQASGILTESNGPEFKGHPIALLVGIVIISPALETLLMGLIFFVLRRFIKHPIKLAVTSAVLWAALHSLAAPAWGLAVLWPFYVFSCAYIAWREKSWMTAYSITCCIHMFQNILPGIAAATMQ